MKGGEGPSFFVCGCTRKVFSFFFLNHLKIYLVTQRVFYNLKILNSHFALPSKVNTRNFKEPTTCFIVLKLRVIWLLHEVQQSGGV